MSSNKKIDARGVEWKAGRALPFSVKGFDPMVQQI
jgi:hypothetical protein